MADYIKREDVRRMLESAQIVSDGNGEYFGYCTEDVKLDEIPGADVRENVYSSWRILRFNDGTTYAHCLNCKTTQVFYRGKEPTNFCPNCGAEMRG